MTYEEITETLRQRGFRLTAARKHVIKVLDQHPEYLGAYDIHHLLEATEMHIGISSIYRVLEMLQNLNLLQQEEFGQGGIRYRLQRPSQPHAHQLICSRCGRTEELGDCPLSHWADRLEQDSGFEIQAHWLRFFGLCPACQITEVRSQKSEARGQRSETRDRKSDVGGQRSETRDQRSDARGQKPEA